MGPHGGAARVVAAAGSCDGWAHRGQPAMQTSSCLHGVLQGLICTYRQDSTFIYYCMALSIKDPEADRLAREVAKATGESLTTAVVQSLRERLARVRRMRGPRLSEELLKIGRRCARLAVKDKRSADEIIGYDEHGLPR